MTNKNLPAIKQNFSKSDLSKSGSPNKNANFRKSNFDQMMFDMNNFNEMVTKSVIVEEKPFKRADKTIRSRKFKRRSKKSSSVDNTFENSERILNNSGDHTDLLIANQSARNTNVIKEENSIATKDSQSRNMTRFPEISKNQPADSENAANKPVRKTKKMAK